jgi:hypothetical protein
MKATTTTFNAKDTLKSLCCNFLSSSISYQLKKEEEDEENMKIPPYPTPPPPQISKGLLPKT